MDVSVEPCVLDGLLSRFGLSQFRAGQRDVIESLLEGRDVLCVMPTGGGKSLCYQLPSLVLPGLTLVVSPLIALMKDQEDQLARLGMRVCAIHSGLEPAEQQARIGRIERGEIDLCYVAPERFRSTRFVEILGRVGLSLLAIDEAHCISEWGHDFRPDYARLGWFRERLGRPRTIALTATATDIVRRDILEQLRLDEPAVFIRGFDRPNLNYAVHRCGTVAEKLDRLVGLREEISGSMIVYSSTRKSCEEAAGVLRARRSRGGGSRDVVVYHAGMDAQARAETQDRFLSGQVATIVATNAFGMGIDKPDIRCVAHFNLPGTIEAYYQEAGRAGRDGLPARCELLYSRSDRFVQEFFIQGAYPDRGLILQVLHFLRQQPDEVISLTRSEIKERVDAKASEIAIGSCLKILEQAGLVERIRSQENMAIVRIHESGPDLTDLLPPSAKTQSAVLRYLTALVGERRGEDVYLNPANAATQLGMERTAFVHAIREIRERVRMDYIPPFRGSATRVVDRATPEHSVPIDFETVSEHRSREFEKLDRMIGFAEARTCRRSLILSYFGESSEACGRCDNCRGQGAESGVADAEATVEAGEIVAAVTLVLEAVASVNGRFGKTSIAAGLAGSNSQKVQRTGLCRKSWHGRLSHVGQNEIVLLIEVLQSIGLLESNGDRMRPTVRLSGSGQAALSDKGGVSGELRLPRSLIGKLSRLPGAVATEKEPTKRVLAPVKGEESGQKNRSVVVDGEDNSRSLPRVARRPVAELGPSRVDLPEMDAHWTGQLLAAGFSIREASKIRRMPIAIILEHADQLSKSGFALAGELLMSDRFDGDSEILRRRILARVGHAD